MPKSRKNKVVSLTKVKRKPGEKRDKKDKLIDQVRSHAAKFPRAYLMSISNSRTTAIQELRAKFRPGVLVCAKNTLMKRALGTSASTECEDGIHKLALKMEGLCSVLFTTLELADVQDILAEHRPVDFARGGAVATQTVVLPKGVEALSALPHSIELHLRQLGLPTRLLEGKIHLLGDHTVCTEGKELSPDAAQVLKLLNIKQAELKFTVEAHWSKGVVEDMNLMED
mmetsp:Transcript_7895/g.21747  ORF Transcript_7895/g.21747 Transcript_7895/m.21747 type:complete len:227 (-) Transcript_7895:97-777(-)|eukprot:CAMPEP_0194488286 /NCGR_PEP_ID=MMETSP0253-20130528/8261_1 /TAXON_ID=2966 /ORGANISM="Noctiluca scintillans" /LENGTH=226 /DNA_ID=CAMNT_0039328625 /DNA_START=38 /DNA_END=718 /DNA_ORIENTATION=-